MTLAYAARYDRAMGDGVEIAAIAALLGDPARGRMLAALMAGTALTATELAVEAEVTSSTASSHLAKLTAANLLTVEQQGRHRYFRIADEEVAQLVERLMGVAVREHRSSARRGPADPALRAARVCYDHLAGQSGVWLLGRLRARELLVGRDAYSVSAAGEAFFQQWGIDVASLARSRRPLCRTCLDWSERRPHLAGALGAAMLERLFSLRWAERQRDSRAVTFSPHGARQFQALLGG